MSTAIKFENISKQYRLGLVSTNTLSHDMNRWYQMNIRGKEDPYLKIGDVNDRSQKGTSDYVWALKDINFEVQQGDVLGIIGKNGAGKSTLLKILSKVTAPSTGIIRAKGRIASLLEVGTGFHPEMTGRENIFMNGAIMGMTKAEINRKLDEIVDFSGVERYIDTPAKRYSSGMTVRLGFAIAAHLDPEILVVDEVLAVGDAEFQKKAIGKMQDVAQGEGRTVLFVSHNMPAVQTLCTHGVILKDGMVAFNGSVHEAIKRYLDDSNVDNETVETHVRIYNKAMNISKITVNNKQNTRLIFDYGENNLNFSMEGTIEIPFNLSVEAMLYDESETLIGMYSPTHVSGHTHNLKKGNFKIEETISFPANLCNGDYYLSVRLSQMNIEHVAEISKLVKISINKNISPQTGVSFDKSYFGQLIFGGK